MLRKFYATYIPLRKSTRTKNVIYLMKKEYLQCNACKLLQQHIEFKQVCISCLTRGSILHDIYIPIKSTTCTL